jgi:hypothetical protein
MNVRSAVGKQKMNMNFVLNVSKKKVINGHFLINNLKSLTNGCERKQYTNYGKGAGSSLMLHCVLIAVFGPAGTLIRRDIAMRTF